MMNPTDPIPPQGEGDIAQQCEVMLEDEARELCAQHNYTWRVSGRDGHYYPITSDMKRNRVTAYIENGRVARARIG